MDDFGKRLKDLRKAANVTQEQLAGALGISYQAVSKWETGFGFPDITLLPGLAGFFGVSADWLLGIKTGDADEIIEKVLVEVSRLKQSAKTNDGIELIEKTLKQYPNNHKLLAAWIEHKVHTFDPSCNKEEWLKKIEEKAEVVLRDCADDAIRYQAKLGLTFAYSFCGEREKAQKLCDTFPEEAYSRVEMYSMVAQPKERGNYKHKCIACDLEKLLVDILSIAKHHYCFGNPKDAIPVCECALNIIESVGNEGFLILYQAETYGDLANTYAKLKDKNNVILYMKKAFQAYLSMDFLSNSGDYYYHSPLLKGEVLRQNKITYGMPLSATERYIHIIAQMHSFDWIREDSEFTALYEEMKTKAIPFHSDRTPQ